MSPALLTALGVMLALTGASALAHHLLIGPTHPTRPPRRWPPRAGIRTRVRRAELVRAGLGAALGTVAALLTQWLVLIPVAAAIAAVFPRLFSAAAEAATVDTLEAMRVWTRSLAGMVSTGASLEHALISSLANTPPALAPTVALLVARLESGWHTPEALAAFAEDLDHPTGDLIATHLIMSARQRGPGLSTALEDLADSVFDEVKMHRQVISDRAKPRMNARVVMALTGAVLLVLPFAGQFSAPYRDPAGQFIYLGWVAIFVAILYLMHRQLQPTPPTRLLDPTTADRP